MKILKNILLFTLLSFVGKVEAQDFDLTGYGDREKTITRFVDNSVALKVTVYQEKPDGSVVRATQGISSGVALIYRTPPSWVETRLCWTKADIDREYRKKLLQMANGALTNTAIDKDKPLTIYAWTTKNEPRFNPPPDYFDVYEEFMLIKTPDGKYALPDFSKKVMNMVPYLVIDLPPKVEWVRVERNIPSYKLGALSQEISVIDSRYDDSGFTDMRFKVLTVDTEDFINGNYLKFSMVGSDYPFTVYNNGVKSAEIPTKLTISRVLQVSGEPGRVVAIERAESILGPWTDTGDQFELPAYPFTYESTYGTIGFYRTRIVNQVPR